MEASSPGLTLEAARLRANHAMAYADAFARPAAIAHGAALLTRGP